MTVVDESVVVLSKVQDDDDTIHWVCHCTNDNIAACGLDVTDSEMLSPSTWGEDDDCPLCVLAWPDGPTCPWGCSCPGECGY